MNKDGEEEELEESEEVRRERQKKVDMIFKGHEPPKDEM